MEDTTMLPVHAVSCFPIGTIRIYYHELIGILLANRRVSPKVLPKINISLIVFLLVPVSRMLSI